MIYQYRCEICQHEQEIWHKLDEKNIESCEECKAEADKMKKVLTPSHKHVSWSLWKVNGDSQ